MEKKREEKKNDKKVKSISKEKELSKKDLLEAPEIYQNNPNGRTYILVE